LKQLVLESGGDTTGGVGFGFKNFRISAGIIKLINARMKGM
jgi:hypothetical protein